MKQPTTKDLADYFTLALEAGLCVEAEVTAWADQMIVENTTAMPGWLLNLSTDVEVSKAMLLSAVPGFSNKQLVWSILFAQMSRLIRAKKFSREHLVRSLYRWEVDGVLPKQYSNEVYALDDGLDGIKSGWHTERAFTEDCNKFFSKFEPFDSFIPKFSGCIVT